MVKKTAQGHIEIILSAVLFIGFLIFLFTLLNPSFRVNEDIETKNIKEAVLKNISPYMGKLSVIVNTTNDCYNLTKVNEKYGNNFIEIQNIDNPRKYTIYYGDFFDSSIIGIISCSNKVNRNFSFGVYSEEQIIVYEKIVDLKTSYQNYETLKQSLEIGDFSFQFKNLDGSIISELSVEGKIPSNIDIASIDFPVRVINNKGKIQEFILNIKAWR